jgi:hypothetical protein
MLADKIIGVWELQIWETAVDGKVVGYPLGENAFGFIAYHPIGFMSVNIAAPNRVRLATDDPFAGDPKLVALDAKGYLSYCGPFSVVSENEVIHHLKLCSFEDWVGTRSASPRPTRPNERHVDSFNSARANAGSHGEQLPYVEAYHFDAIERVGKIAAVACQFVVAAYDRGFARAVFSTLRERRYRAD